MKIIRSLYWDQSQIPVFLSSFRYLRSFLDGLAHLAGFRSRLLLRVSVLGFPPEDHESASKEAVWLAEDSRKAGSFSEVRKIRFGSDVGART